MKTAKELFELAVNQNTNKIDSILSEIEKIANLGKMSCVIDQLTFTEIRTLESLGFKIIPNIDGNFWIINWNEFKKE